MSEGISVRGMAIAVLGAGLTGRTVARTLLELGANVCVYDTRSAEELGSELLEGLRDLPCPVTLGARDGLADHSLIVTSPGVSVHDPFHADARAAGIEVISEVELAYRLWPQVRVIGITGTNGKSTTTALTGAMLRESGTPARVCGNIGLPFISEVAGVASRGPVEDTWFVAELSSFQLEATVHFRPCVAALLNLTDDHADRHPTRADYLAAKARLFANQTEDDTAVLSATDAACRELASRLRARVVWFGLQPMAAHCLYARCRTVVCRDADGETEVADSSRMRLVGAHNLENALAATACSLAAGATAEGIQRALDTFDAAPHTFRCVGTVGGVVCINDSKGTNVDATLRGLSGIDAPFVLIAGGSDKGAHFTELGRFLADRARGLVVLGATADAIAGAAREFGLEMVARVESMEEAVQAALGMARPGDYVVLSPACASFGLFQNYGHRGRVFEEAVSALPGFRPTTACEADALAEYTTHIRPR